MQSAESTATSLYAKSVHIKFLVAEIPQIIIDDREHAAAYVTLLKAQSLFGIREQLRSYGITLRDVPSGQVLWDVHFE